MAFRHGKSAQLSVAGTEIGTFLDNLSLEMTGETADTTTFGSSWRSHIAGLKGSTLSLGGSFDPTASTGVSAVLVAALGVESAYIYKPGGTATGQQTFTFQGLLTSYNPAAVVDDKVTVAGEVLVTGAVTVTTQ